jgi:bifunctional non-homologous end joining protein LigD
MQHSKRCLYRLDGVRCLVRKSRERNDLLSREGNRFNVSFPDIVDAVAAVPGDSVWDTELAVCGARGKDAFSSLQQRARTTSLRSVPAAARRCTARLYVLDMLASGARDLRGLALTGVIE